VISGHVSLPPQIPRHFSSSAKEPYSAPLYPFFSCFPLVWPPPLVAPSAEVHEQGVRTTPLAFFMFFYQPFPVDWPEKICPFLGTIQRRMLISRTLLVIGLFFVRSRHAASAAPSHLPPATLATLCSLASPPSVIWSLSSPIVNKDQQSRILPSFLNEQMSGYFLLPLLAPILCQNGRKARVFSQTGLK